LSSLNTKQQTSQLTTYRKQQKSDSQDDISKCIFIGGEDSVVTMIPKFFENT
jgi:hypothetical protein